MREPAFLRQNKDKWLEYERMLFESKQSEINPDRLAELYVQLTDDLAYARTFYPRSQVVRYLNGLAARTHLAIYRNKKDPGSRFVTFWTRELPMIYARNHRYMLYAFLIFSFSFLLGVLGALHEEDFVRVVLGDPYVDMTLDNIADGDPMGVYKRSSPIVMFVEIAFNNIRVAFNTFALGGLLSVGTIYLLFYNGVMVGAFLTFFHTQNQLWEALPVVYIHGTLELSAIVIAGGAGFMLGNSILFPGTYTRLVSAQRGAREGVKILVGLVPVFLMAAFLESFITRLTEMWLGFKLAIIFVSLAFVVWYYVLFPIIYARQIGPETVHA
jgi:uncharacterized membrane protein SpoIIM required for sporulation